MKAIGKKAFASELTKRLKAAGESENIIDTYVKVAENMKKIALIEANKANDTKKVAIVMMGMHAYSITNPSFVRAAEWLLHDIPEAHYNEETMIREFKEKDDEDKKELQSEMQRWC